MKIFGIIFTTRRNLDSVCRAYDEIENFLMSSGLRMFPLILGR